MGKTQVEKKEENKPESKSGIREKIQNWIADAKKRGTWQTLLLKQVGNTRVNVVVTPDGNALLKVYINRPQNGIIFSLSELEDIKKAIEIVESIKNELEQIPEFKNARVSLRSQKGVLDE
jgi:hypothetical protein